MTMLLLILLIFSLSTKALNDQNVPGVVGCILEKRVEQEITYKRSIMSLAQETGWLFFHKIMEVIQL